MSLPTPNQFRELIPVPDASFCGKFVKIVRRLAEYVWNWFSYEYDDDGNFTEEYKAKLREIVCVNCGTGGGGGGTGFAAPINVQATDGTYTDRVVVTWDAVTLATGYEVYASRSSVFSGATKLGTTVTNSFTHDNPEFMQTYWYWVVAYNATQRSAEGGPDTGYTGEKLAANVLNLVTQGWSFPVGPIMAEHEEAYLGLSASAPSALSEIRFSLTADSRANLFKVWANTTEDFNSAYLLHDKIYVFDNGATLGNRPPGADPDAMYANWCGDYIYFTYSPVLGQTRKTAQSLHLTRYPFTPYNIWVQAFSKEPSGKVVAFSDPLGPFIGWPCGSGVSGTMPNNKNASGNGNVLYKRLFTMPSYGAASYLVPNTPSSDLADGPINKAFIVLRGCCGSGGNSTSQAAGGGGGGCSIVYGVIDIASGDTIELTPTASQHSTQAQGVDGQDGNDVTMKINAADFLTITGGKGGKAAVGAVPGTGGAAGECDTDPLPAGLTEVAGSDGQDAVLLVAGRGGSYPCIGRSPRSWANGQLGQVRTQHYQGGSGADFEAVTGRYQGGVAEQCAELEIWFYKA